MFGCNGCAPSSHQIGEISFFLPFQKWREGYFHSSSGRPMERSHFCQTGLGFLKKINSLNPHLFEYLPLVFGYSRSFIPFFQHLCSLWLTSGNGRVTSVVYTWPRTALARNKLQVLNEGSCSDSHLVQCYTNALSVLFLTRNYRQFTGI